MDETKQIRQMENGGQGTQPTPGRIDADEVLDTLEVTKVERRVSAGGVWVSGRIARHRFNALVFAEPAVNRTWEVNADSRISKLWLQRHEDKVTVYNWDRGTDIQPQTDLAAMIVELLAEGLANLIWGLKKGI